MHRASMIVICLLLGACSSGLPEVRPSHSGFGATGAVLQPLADGKRDLAAGRNGLAIRRFGEALGRQPRSLEALNGLAVAYAGIGRHDVAQTYFERALEIDAGDVATLNNYGRSLIEQGRLREAKPFLEQALRRAPENDVPTIAANILSIRDAAPPALLTASRRQPERQPARSGRLVRVAADRYRLQTFAPAAGPTPLFDVATWPLPRVTSRLQMAALAPQPQLPGTQTPGLHDRAPIWSASLVPPLPRMKPAAPPLPLARPVLAARALGADPAGLHPVPHTTIREVMERRIAGTGVETLLDGLGAAPAVEPDVDVASIGEWT